MMVPPVVFIVCLWFCACVSFYVFVSSDPLLQWLSLVWHQPGLRAISYLVSKSFQLCHWSPIKCLALLKRKMWEFIFGDRNTWSLQFYTCPVAGPHSCQKQGNSHCRNWGCKTGFMKNSFKNILALWETGRTWGIRLCHRKGAWGRINHSQQETGQDCWFCLGIGT